MTQSVVDIDSISAAQLNNMLGAGSNVRFKQEGVNVELQVFETATSEWRTIFMTNGKLESEAPEA
jgi:hypothetical protein